MMCLSLIVNINMSDMTPLQPVVESVEGPAMKKVKSASGSATPVPIPQTILSDQPEKIETQENIVKKSTKTIEEIIDGSDVRRFLNRTITGYMVNGLKELVEKYEKGGFKVPSDKESKARVVDDFCAILKELASRDEN